MIRSIAHPTDLSPEGAPAFEHALRLAMVRRCHFNVLHVRHPGGKSDWKSFPHVREVLQRWGMLEPGAGTADVHARTGVSVKKVDIRDSGAVDGLARFLEEHPADLLVMRSHGRAGLDRLVNTSVSFELAQESSVPTLILGPAARPFVDSRTGNIDLETVLVPVDHHPPPNGAIDLLESLLDGLGVELDFLHVGDNPPELHGAGRPPRPVRTIGGPVVETLLEEAGKAGLIAMPTAGRQGLRDALRGSTTERVIREATCPVLAIPAAS
ncbi:MAG: universal stress protein [Allosphingosinicella sp.]